MSNSNRNNHGTKTFGYSFEPVKLNVYVGLFTIVKKINYNVQCNTIYNQFTWYKAYQS